MPPQVPIGGEERRTQQGGELTGRGAAQEIHLKEPVLGVQIAECECKIVAILGGNGRHAVGIAGHANACLDASVISPAVERGKARAQNEPCAEGCEDCGCGEDDARHGADASGAEASGAGQLGAVALGSSHPRPGRERRAMNARASMRASFPHGTP